MLSLIGEWQGSADWQCRTPRPLDGTGMLEGHHWKQQYALLWVNSDGVLNSIVNTRCREAVPPKKITMPITSLDDSELALHIRKNLQPGVMNYHYIQAGDSSLTFSISTFKLKHTRFSTDPWLSRLEYVAVRTWFPLGSPEQRLSLPRLARIVQCYLATTPGVSWPMEDSYLSMPQYNILNVSW
jgi:hypothetical protein